MNDITFRDMTKYETHGLVQVNLEIYLDVLSLRCVLQFPVEMSGRQLDKIVCVQRKSSSWSQKSGIDQRNNHLLKNKTECAEGN